MLAAALFPSLMATGLVVGVSSRIGFPKLLRASEHSLLFDRNKDCTGPGKRPETAAAQCGLHRSLKHILGLRITISWTLPRSICPLMSGGRRWPSLVTAWDFREKLLCRSIAAAVEDFASEDRLGGEVGHGRKSPKVRAETSGIFLLECTADTITATVGRYDQQHAEPVDPVSGKVLQVYLVPCQFCITGTFAFGELTRARAAMAVAAFELQVERRPLALAIQQKPGIGRADDLGLPGKLDSQPVVVSGIGLLGVKDIGFVVPAFQGDAGLGSNGGVEDHVQFGHRHVVPEVQRMRQIDRFVKILVIACRLGKILAALRREQVDGCRNSIEGTGYECRVPADQARVGEGGESATSDTTVGVLGKYKLLHVPPIKDVVAGKGF